ETSSSSGSLWARSSRTNDVQKAEISVWRNRELVLLVSFVVAVIWATRSPISGQDRPSDKRNAEKDSREEKGLLSRVQTLEDDLRATKQALADFQRRQLEGLRVVICGFIDNGGRIKGKSGEPFDVKRTEIGVYKVTFTNAFPDEPIVV